MRIGIDFSGGYGILPNGWTASRPAAGVTKPARCRKARRFRADGTMLAVVESGFNPAALTIYAVPGLRLVRRVAWPAHSGGPSWTNASHSRCRGERRCAFSR